MEAEPRPQDMNTRASPNKRPDQEPCCHASSGPGPLQGVTGLAEGAEQASVGQCCAQLTSCPRPMLGLSRGREPGRTPSGASCWFQIVAELGPRLVWKLPKPIVFLIVSMLGGAGVEPGVQVTSPATRPHSSVLGNLRNSWTRANCGLVDKSLRCCPC